MVTLAQKINAIIEPAVQALGYELVGCELQDQGRRKLLRVYVDGEKGITIDACAKVSRQIGAVLDVEDAIAGAYNLEVSSPGLDRPLFTLEQYAKFIGYKVKVQLRMAQQNRRRFSGLLESINDDEVVFELEDGEKLRVKFDLIVKARLIPELG